MSNEFLESLNSLQIASIEKLRNTLRGSHYTDVTVRCGGKNHQFEADWLADALDRLCYVSRYWKHDFLFTRRLIDRLVDHHLPIPRGVVQELLLHHLRKASELLAADVNGGLEEFYEDEAEITFSQHSTVREPNG